MRLSYFKSRHGNVGDDLNAVLWPKVFGPTFFDEADDTLFLGIGSIFDNRPEIARPVRPVVFGSGLRSRRRAPADPGLFDIRFVRGPLSADVLKRYQVAYISDPAIIAPLYLPSIPQERSFKMGYVPYFKTPDSLGRAIADAIGARLISPTLTPQDFINEIASCDKIISEAMHGAILADAYRIPWAGVRLISGGIEGRVSLFKWADWMKSLGISARLNGPVPELTLYAPRRIRKLFDSHTVQRAVSTVEEIVRADRWNMSGPEALSQAQDRIHAEVEKIRKDYPNG